jgi:hypothetical protein
MSVAHDPANPNFFVNITGDFSLSITANGDSGIVNLVYVEGGGPTYSNANCYAFSEF